MLKFIIFFNLFCSFLRAQTLGEQLAWFEPLEQKPFVVVITSYNNRDWYQKNLNSVITQFYDNYRLIYIDDCSSDGTADLVENYLQEQKFDRYTLIKNSQWQSQMANHYKAVYLCDDCEIIIHIDGDDWLNNPYVLQLLNKVYCYRDVWLTYGQYQAWPDGWIGGSHEISPWMISANAFREGDFCYSHPRSFYAWLFKKIKLKDLIYKGSFIPIATAPDLAFMFAMVELAGSHIQFIPDILYQYNRANGLSQHNIPVTKDYPPVQTWQKYQQLEKAEINISKNWITKKIALIMIDNQNDVAKWLLQEVDHIKGIDTIFLISFVDNPAYYQALKELFPQLFIVNVEADNLHTLQLFDYALLLTDLRQQLKEINIPYCIQALEQTQAYAFFLQLTKNNFKPCHEPINYAPFAPAVIEYCYVPVMTNILAWQGEYEEYVWQDQSIFNSVIVPMRSIIEVIQKSNSYNNFNHQIKDLIYEKMHQDRQVGLLFAE